MTLVIVLASAFFLGMGLFALARPAALGGMALGRLISGVIDMPKAFYPNWFYFVVEVVAAGALLWAVGGW